MRILQLLARAYDLFLSWIPALVLRLLARFGYTPPLRIVAYDGYATDELGVVRGRVLMDQREEAADRTGRALTLIQRSEIPRATVRVTVAGRAWTVAADQQGYFRLDALLPVPLGAGWHTLQVELVNEWARRAGPVPVEARLLVPSDAAPFAVVSDLDDTLLRSHSASGAQMVAEVMGKKPAEREVVPGMGVLYRAIRAAGAPFFYHSSAGWDTYEHLRAAFRENDLPLGPMFLRAYSAERMLRESDTENKVEAIREVMTRFPDLPVLLVGDAAGVDAEAYLEIAREAPQRVLAVWLLRAGSDAARLWEVEALADRIREAGVEALVADSPQALAHRARERGWIGEAGEARARMA